MSTELMERTRTGRPRLRTHSDVFAYWGERITRPLSQLPNERESRGSMGYSNDILTYGGVDLAQIIRHANGHARLVLLNGDNIRGSGWGHSPAQYQRSARDIVSREIAGTNIESLVVPFSCLDSADIDQKSIRPLEVKPDRNVKVPMESSERPSGDPVKMPDPSGATYDHVEQKWGYVHRETGEVFTSGLVNGVWEHSPANREDYEWRQYDHHEDRLIMVNDPDAVKIDYKGHGWIYEPARLHADGVWRWTINRHYLGESLFRARLTETRYRKPTEQEIANRDAWEAHRSERERLYDKVRSLRNDLEDAKNGQQRWDRDVGRYVTVAEPNPERASELRIEINAADAEINTFLDAHSEPGYPVIGRNDMVAYTVRRWATFLSSFDYAEPQVPYFMVELPHKAKAATVEEAIDALKPESVRTAEAAGLEVLRQGDVFAIPTGYSEKDLLPRAKPFHRKVWEINADGQAVLGERLEYIAKHRRGDKEALVLKLNHAPTHVIRTKDGATFGRGRLYHAPTGWNRRPEHQVVTLGDGKTQWYRMVRNTVPEDRSGGPRSFTPRAWTVVGTVD